jgi:hypothetical protein
VVAYNKFNQFVEDLCNKALDHFGSPIGDTLKLGLTNVSPNAADTHVDTALSPDVIEATSNATEIASGNGYTEGGETVSANGTRSGGTVTLDGDQVVWTCVTSPMATFRYTYLYNNTGGAAATRPVVSWWDYGSAVALAVGETFTVKFNNVATDGTIYTLA